MRRSRCSLPVGVLALTISTACSPTQPPAAVAAEREGSLRVSELVVVDRNGVERIRIAGDLPDAIINGKRVPRGERAAGIVLYDSTGQERSGYVSWEPSGNVGLTLDTRFGQAAVLVASREPGTALMMWNGRDMIELRSDADGSRFSAVKNGEVVYQDPEVTAISAGICTEYKKARSRVSEDHVVRDCRRRFREGACRACLSQP